MVSPGGASLLLTGARIYTADRSNPWAEALVVRGGCLEYVGAEIEARRRASGCEHLHVPGGLAVPGLNDAHIHLSYGARALELLDLTGESAEGMRSRLREYAREHPKREWIESFGLPYEAMGGARVPRLHLDDVIGDRPVLVRAFDYHTAWCNSEALRRAGLERGSSSLPGVIVDGEAGLATGTLLESPAIDAVVAAIPPWDEETVDGALAQAMRAVNRLGITSVQNMDGDLERVAQYERLERRGGLSVRAAHYFRFPTPELLQSLPGLAQAMREYASPANRVAGLKLFLDGVIESKTAWLAEPYADGSGERGHPFIEVHYYATVVREAHRLGISVATHAIGDAAVHAALDSYAAVLPVASGARHRLEHIETLLPGDASRFGRIGVVASMQPIHATPASDPASALWNRHVGKEREQTAFAWKTIAESGATLAFGSDWPIMSADPRVGLSVALSRINPDGLPHGGWHREHCLTLGQALNAYTRDAAHAEGQEAVKGVLRAGSLGDITVFAEDLFRLRPDELPAVPVAATILGGKPLVQSA